MTVGYDCEKGYYCEGTDGTTDMTETVADMASRRVQIRPTPCPIGTHGDEDDTSGTRWSSSNDCIACEAGSFCDTPGQIANSGSCDSGFICGEGQSRPGPYATVYDKDGLGNVNVASGKCSSGNKCSAGALEPTACAAKFYTPSTGVQYS